MNAQEVNFDGIVGPTHNYAGLSFGNVASTRHRLQVSNPRAAALQGLEKMRANSDAGFWQAVLPPAPRPRLDFLRSLGFSGPDAAVVRQVADQEPVLLAIAYSAASMWAANAATVSPSADCQDNRVHLTPANLAATMHRALEADSTTRVLQQIFANDQYFQVHRPLLGCRGLSDEGAANHTRLAPAYAEPGIELFTYGFSALDPSRPQPTHYPARQSLEASQAIARRHHLQQTRTVFAQQSPQAIDAGVFHNDVIAVGNLHVLLVHEAAFVDQQAICQQLAEKFRRTCDSELQIIEIAEDLLPLPEAVASYLFNSQLLGGDNRDQMVLVCPTDCQNNPAAKLAIEHIIAQPNSISHVRFMDVRQSMDNGGGPACLRLRVVLTRQERDRLHQPVILTPGLFERLTNWVTEHYRESLTVEDLRDPQLLIESDRALRELERILHLTLAD